MNEIMEGAATPVQVAGFAVALRMKGETAGELAGLSEVMLRRATPISVPGPLVDLVGTGGDGAHTVNISTMGAIVAAAAGVRVVKHGNRAASSACGAADVLEALGVVINLPPAGHRASWRRRPGSRSCSRRCTTRHSGTRRSRAASCGVPTVFNCLGPVSNPARPRSQAVGVSDPRMGGVIAGVLAGRGCSALVFHGDDGLDELTPTTTSTVWVVHDGTVTQTVFDPAVLGLDRARPEDLRGGDREHNAAVARAVLGGERGPVRDTVLLNAAAALAASPGSRAPRRWTRPSPRRSPGPARPSIPGPPRTCWTAGWRPASGSPSRPASRVSPGARAPGSPQRARSRGSSPACGRRASTRPGGTRLGGPASPRAQSSS